MSDAIGYWRVKAKCLNCSLHFMLCTWKPARHCAASLFCPECGQHNGNFLVWREEVPSGVIYEEVPGHHTAGWEGPRLVRRRWWQFWKAS